MNVGNSINNVANYVLSWKSKGLSDETIKPPSTSDNSITPSISYINNTDKIGVKFTGSCLKQSNKLTYTNEKVVNIYIVYELGASSFIDSDPTIKKCLFGAVTLEMHILINTDIMVMELDLIEDQAFHFAVVDLLKI